MFAFREHPLAFKAAVDPQSSQTLKGRGCLDVEQLLASKYQVPNPMLNIALMSFTAVLAAAGAFALAPPWLGRNLSLWEDLLCGGLVWLIAGLMLRYRKRQERKRLIGMRDSALW